MSSLAEIQAKIRGLYSRADRPAVDAPLGLRAVAYCHYAREYLEAARVLSEREDLQQHKSVLMPWYQLIGQALELAMKACLAVKGTAPPMSHNLVDLCRRVEAHGFRPGVEHFHAHLVHLNHCYFEDLATGDRFVARYGGGGSWIVPDHARLATACESLIVQANELNPMLRGGTLPAPDGNSAS